MAELPNKGNCALEKLLEYQDDPYLNNAPVELIDLLKERFKNCEAINNCISLDFWGFCDCRLILENKLAYKPQEPSFYIKNMREREDKAITRFINSIRGLTDSQRDLLFQKSNELKYQYSIPMMPEIKKLLNSLKSSEQ